MLKVSMKHRFWSILFLVTFFPHIKGQLSGTYSVPATFPTLASAITSLNLGGVSGPVTIAIAAGYTETVTSNGFSMTATGTATSPIVFQKSGVGANPLLIAYSGGIATPSSALQDGMWRLIGSDFVTIDGIDLQDPNSLNPETMEFGIALFKASPTDGCMNNTIKNCVFTLNRINNQPGSGPAFTGSRAIEVVNALSSSHTTSVAVTSSVGANSFNKFYNNLVQNCNVGISLSGFVDVSPYTNSDNSNDVGGLTAATGNTIINYGGAANTTYSAAAVRTRYQENLNVSNNYIDNNDGTGFPHSYQLSGIYAETARMGTISINSNTISLKSTNNNNYTYGVYCSGNSNLISLININNNTIRNCLITHTLGTYMHGIVTSCTSSTININNNAFTNNTISAQFSGYESIISASGAVYTNILGNLTSGLSATLGVGITGVRAYRSSAGNTATLVTIASNTFESASFANNSSMQFSFIHNSFSNVAATASVIISNNLCRDVTMGINSYLYFINDENNAAANINVSGNSVLNFTNNAAGGQNYGYRNDENPVGSGSVVISSNTFSNLVLPNVTIFDAVHFARGIGSQSLNISNNNFNSIHTGTGAVRGIYVSATMNSVTVIANSISDFSCTNNITGIQLGGFFPVNISQNAVGSFTGSGTTINGVSIGSNDVVNFSRNKLFDLNGLGVNSRVSGVLINGGSDIDVQQNLIGILRAPASTSANAVNAINVAGGSTVNLYYNTIKLDATSTSTLFGSSILNAAAASATITCRNNIFINLSVASGTGITTVYRNSNVFNYGAASNNNIVYAGIPSASNVLYRTSSTSYQDLNAFKTFFSPRDANSFTENTNFLSVVGTSSNFLHVGPLSLAESHAVNIPGITNDYDLDIRQGNIGYTGTGVAPDIGADEFNSPNCTTVSAVTIYTPTSFTICAGQSVTLTSSEDYIIPGISRNWQWSTAPGGPYTVIPSATTSVYNTPTLTSGTYYYVVANSCSFTSMNAVSNIATVQVNVSPVVSAGPASLTLCRYTSTVLTASGATNYTWTSSPNQGGGNSSSITISPTLNTTYFVVGSNPGGCNSTNTVSINVISLYGSSNLTVSATPSLVCQGSSATLSAVATTTVYSVTPIAFSPISTPTSGAGVGLFCNNGSINTAMSSGNLNDGGWGSYSIPFNFSLYGVLYNQFYVSTNGFITLGFQATPNFSGYGNALPSFAASVPCIGAIYGNLDFSNSGYIMSTTSGTTPNQKLIINWVGGRFFNGASGTGTITTQLILYETSNHVEVHTTTSTGQLNAVEGIQNNSATQACVVPGRNAQTFTITNDAYRWHFPLNYTWTPSLYLSNTNNSVTLANGIQSNVVYTVSAISGNGCGASAVRTISVIPGPSLSISGGTASVCAGTTVSLTASGSNTYSWTGGGSSASLVVTPAITTTYAVTGTWTVNACTGSASQIVTVNPNPTLSISGNSFICSGQSAVLTATGADTYLWSNNSANPVISISPGTTSTYSVTGTNTLGNCTGTAVTTVSVYPNPTLAILGNTLLCTGQSTSLTATGADTYSWSHGPISQSLVLTPLTNTLFSLIGTNTLGACTSSTSISLSVTPTPTLAFQGVTAICTGQSASLAVNGASTYSWNTGATTNSISVNPLSTTVYSVTGTNILNGCSSGLTITLAVAPLPTVSISGPSVICTGQSVALLGSGASNYTWSTGSTQASISVSPLSALAYSVIGISGPGCSGIAHHSLSVNALPEITLVALPASTICEGQSVQLNATSNGVNTYSWNNVPGSSSISLLPPTSTVYSVLVFNTLTGCTNSATISVHVSLCTLLDKEQLKNNLRIFPNPFSNLFYLEWYGEEETTYEIIDMGSRVIQSGNIKEGRNSIDMSDYTRGMYFIRIYTQPVIYAILVSH